LRDCRKSRGRAGPRTVSDEQIEQIVITTLESKPKHATHWSVRSLAAHLGVSQDAVWRTWQAFGLAPHRQEKFKLPPTRSSSRRSMTSAGCA
jgi:DNA-binding MurR/RpiR family transcriptional regulator